MGGWVVGGSFRLLTHLSFSSSEAASSSWDRSDLKSSRNAKSVTIVEVVETSLTSAHVDPMIFGYFSFSKFEIKIQM